MGWRDIVPVTVLLLITVHSVRCAPGSPFMEGLALPRLGQIATDSASSASEAAKTFYREIRNYFSLMRSQMFRYIIKSFPLGAEYELYHPVPKAVVNEISDAAAAAAAAAAASSSSRIIESVRPR